ncbi:MAG: hypothetical protein U9P07_00810 [Pseudomonadota bacterium]|nr:hypothetical protein [Pseudomonadota bacterium]
MKYIPAASGKTLDFLSLNFLICIARDILAGCSGIALAHSRRPSMACLCVPHADRPACGDTAKAMSPRPPRITSCDSFGGQTAMSHAGTSLEISFCCF